MTPTIEEVKRVFKKCGASEAYATEMFLLCKGEFFITPEELQAFAQHWIEVGRKEQRESDACMSRIAINCHTRIGGCNCNQYKFGELTGGWLCPVHGRQL